MDNQEERRVVENPELELAKKLIEKTSGNLFLTGRAGTGKTTFLKQLRAESPKRMVVVAPTGIAAINAGGVTIHSFFQLDFGPYVPGSKRGAKSAYRFSEAKKELIRAIDLLVIDEISMVRSDLLDNIDDTLRRFRNPSKPFGGVQLLMIGDLQQLPPVVTEEEEGLLNRFYDSPYFFDSRALKEAGYSTIELQHVYRQSDSRFIELLNRIRDNMAGPDTLSALNSRYIPGFRPEGTGERYVRLVTHNRQAREINEARMAELEGKEFIFSAEISGRFPESSYPADTELRLKKGAQVMFVRNDSSGERRYYNGSLGEIESLDEKEIRVRIHESGETIKVIPEQWENNRFDLNEESGEIEEIKEGEFRQYPLRLAWAITIHKSQGLTFSHAVINASAAFAHGQTYVALSRCKTLEGIVLERPLTAASVITDRRVSEYLRVQHGMAAGLREIDKMENAYLRQLLLELFDFMPVCNRLNDLNRSVAMAYGNLFPSVVERFRSAEEGCRRDVRDVALRFAALADSLLADLNEENRTKLAEKIRGGCRYFREKLEPLLQTVMEMPVQTDNKETKKRLLKEKEVLQKGIRLKLKMLRHFSDNPFEADAYLRSKSLAEQEVEKEERTASRKLAAKKSRPAVPKEVERPEIYEALRRWRAAKAEAANKPAFTVLHNKTLLNICAMMPSSEPELKRVPGIGPTIMENWGREILDILNNTKKRDDFS